MYVYMYIGIYMYMYIGIGICIYIYVCIDRMINGSICTLIGPLDWIKTVHIRQGTTNDSSSIRDPPFILATHLNGDPPIHPPTNGPTP